MLNVQCKRRNHARAAIVRSQQLRRTATTLLGAITYSFQVHNLSQQSSTQRSATHSARIVFAIAYAHMLKRQHLKATQSLFNCLGIGPVNIHSKVQQAMDRPAQNHRDPWFNPFFSGILEDSKMLFQTTKGTPFIFPGTGTGGWEVGLTNTLSPGDKIVTFRYGQFSLLWVDMMQRLGLDVHVIDERWGNGASEERLEKVHKYSLLSADSSPLPGCDHIQPCCALLLSTCLPDVMHHCLASHVYCFCFLTCMHASVSHMHLTLLCRTKNCRP